MSCIRDILNKEALERELQRIKRAFNDVKDNEKMRIEWSINPINLEMKKIYCSECKYCGEIIKYLNPLNPYSLCNSEHRICDCPDIKEKQVNDDWFERREITIPKMCHEINKNNDCGYFKENEEWKK